MQREPDLTVSLRPAIRNNLASEKVILKNGGIREDKRCDKEEQVFIKRFWIDL